MKEIKTNYLSLIPTFIWSWIIVFIPSAIKALEIYFTKYTYNNDNIIIKKGIAKQEQLSVPFYRLNDIQINQNIIGQFLKFGTITLYDKDKVVTMEYVDNPEEIANKLRDMMMKAKKENGLKVTDIQ